MRELILFKDRPEILRQVSTEVLEFGTALNHVIDDLTYVMRSCEKAIGIAAIQANHPLRLGLLELNHGSKTPGKPTVIINPKIVTHGGIELADESCLSLPGLRTKKRRPTLLKLSYRDQNGQHQETTFRGIWARCVAHELDHLDGKLIIDR